METFNIKLPTSWEELSDKQLLMVYGLYARDLSAAGVKTLCLMKWNGLKVLASLPRHRFLVGIFYWMASLKQYFASLFPNFYKPASTMVESNLLGNGQPDIYSQLRDSTNAMIRALTGGDITKEAAIMKMDTLRS